MPPQQERFVYSTLREVHHAILPPEGIPGDRKRTVNVYGVVVSASKISQSKRDWYVNLMITDSSFCREPGAPLQYSPVGEERAPPAMSINIFAADPAHLPRDDLIHVGQVVRLHRVLAEAVPARAAAHEARGGPLGEYSGRVGLSGPRGSRLAWLFFDGTPGASLDPLQSSGRDHTFEEEDRRRVEAMREFWAEERLVWEERAAAHGAEPVAPAGVQRLCDTGQGAALNVHVQVVAVHRRPASRPVFYVWDGSDVPPPELAPDKEARGADADDGRVESGEGTAPERGGTGGRVSLSGIPDSLPLGTRSGAWEFMPSIPTYGSIVPLVSNDGRTGSAGAGQQAGEGGSSGGRSAAPVGTSFDRAWWPLRDLRCGKWVELLRMGCVREAHRAGLVFWEGTSRVRTDVGVNPTSEAAALAHEEGKRLTEWAPRPLVSLPDRPASVGRVTWKDRDTHPHGLWGLPPASHRQLVDAGFRAIPDDRGVPVDTVRAVRDACAGGGGRAFRVVGWPTGLTAFLPDEADAEGPRKRQRGARAPAAVSGRVYDTGLRWAEGEDEEVLFVLALRDATGELAVRVTRSAARELLLGLPGTRGVGGGWVTLLRHVAGGARCRLEGREVVEVSKDSGQRAVPWVDCTVEAREVGDHVLFFMFRTRVLV